MRYSVRNRDYGIHVPLYRMCSSVALYEKIEYYTERNINHSLSLAATYIVTIKYFLNFQFPYIYHNLIAFILQV